MYRLILLIVLQINIAFLSYGFIEPVNVPNHINFTAQIEVRRDVGVEALSQGNVHRDPNRGGIIVNNNPLIYVDPLGLYAESPADMASLAMSVDEFQKSPGIVTGAAVLLDSIGLATPFIPSIAGFLLKGAKAVDKVEDVLVLGRGPKSRLENLAKKEGGRISTQNTNVPKEIFKNNYSDMRKADKIIQYMDDVPTSQAEVIANGGAGQYSRAEAYMIDNRPDLKQKTTRKYENG